MNKYAASNKYASIYTNITLKHGIHREICVPNQNYTTTEDTMEYTTFYFYYYKTPEQ